MKHVLAKVWMVVAALLLSACGGGDDVAGGTPTYAKSYGGTRFDAAHAIAGTADGGTVIAGVTAANRDGNCDDEDRRLFDSTADVAHYLELSASRKADAPSRSAPRPRNEPAK